MLIKKPIIALRYKLRDGQVELNIGDLNQADSSYLDEESTNELLRE